MPYLAVDKDVARVKTFTLAMLQVLSLQSNFTYFMHMRAKAICDFQISYRPRTAVIYARRGQWINKVNTINNINRDQRSAIRDHTYALHTRVG